MPEPQRDPASNAAFALRVDLREFTTAYFLDVELPGIHGPNDIGMRWLDRSTLQIQVTIEKTDLEAEWGDLIPYDQPQEIDLSDRKHEDKYDERNNLGEKFQEQELRKKSSSESLMTRFWLDERRSGIHMRNFDFALAVDTDAIQVRLSQGLLKVFVPKKNITALETKVIQIATA
jgi:HSP20 family molecular chaperone IbpA